MSSVSVLSENSKILVVGDIMLDRYLWGEVSRISPEAPVPVVKSRKKSAVPGGAGNVAANLAGLECGVAVIGVCGPDEAGGHLDEIFQRKGIENLLQIDKSRPTITKTRIMANRQQIFRLDEEETHALSSELQSDILKTFERKLPLFDVVVLSDYGKGMLQDPENCRAIINLCREQGKPVLVDPKKKEWDRYKGATCVTPNIAELELVTGEIFDDDEKKIVSSAKGICSQFGFEWLLVTRGSRGMCLVSPKEEPVIVPARAREVFDVSGAGDTVIAALAAGLASGMVFPVAAKLANTAAGIVVGKLGTQPVTLAELNSQYKMEEMDNGSAGTPKMLTVEAAELQVRAWQTAGEKNVFTNGCFDLLHPGHIHLLHQARALGDRLIVGLNTDASVKRLKGEKRPILSEQDRGAILSALGCVDMVVLFDEDTPLSLIRALKPDILVKGADYKIEDVVGREDVEEYGGKVCLVPLLKGYSTTDITDKLISANNKKQ